MAIEALGQVSGSASLVSDYRFRGVSLSQEKPALQLNVLYDDQSGWYAGAFASSVQIFGQHDRHVELVPFLGYARRLGTRLSWDAGVEYSSFPKDGGYNYPEIYLGLNYDRFSARIYYSPRYFGQESNSIYAELNGSHALSDRIQLFVHAGALRRNRSLDYAPARSAYDARAGVAVDLDPYSVHLSWGTISTTSAGYPIYSGSNRSAVVVNVTRYF